MSAGNGGEYKRTIFDRRGPDATHFLRMVSSLAIPIVAGAFIAGALAVRRRYPPTLIVVSGLGARSGMRDRAEIWYRGVQRLPRVGPKDDIYAPNRLVDLYRAWPGHEK